MPTEESLVSEESSEESSEKSSKCRWDGILNSSIWSGLSKWNREAFAVLGAFGAISVILSVVLKAFLPLSCFGMSLIVFGLFFLFLWLPFVLEVPQENTYLLLRFGKFAGFLQEGWRWIIPLIESVPDANKVSFRTETWDIKEGKEGKIIAITKEGLKIPVNLALRFKVNRPEKGTPYDEQSAFQWVFGFKDNRELRESLFTMAQGRVRALAAGNPIDLICPTDEKTTEGQSGPSWQDFLGYQKRIETEIESGSKKIFKDYSGLELYGVDVQEIEIPQAITDAKEVLEKSKLTADARKEAGRGEGEFMQLRAEGFKKAREILLAAGVDQKRVDNILVSLEGYDRWRELATKKGAIVVQPDVHKLELNLYGESEDLPPETRESKERGRP